MVERTAYHEAGHAVVLRRFKRQDFEHGYITIIVTQSGEGLTQTFQPTHGLQTPPLTHHETCLLALAGRAAEEIQFPELSYGAAQLSLGDEELIDQLSSDDLSENDINALLDEVKMVLHDDWPAVRMLAKRLFIARNLDGVDALRLMDEARARGSC
jgi:Peptidase family M41